MKQLLLLPFLGYAALVNGQGVFSNEASTLLEKIVQDYSTHFSHITGEKIAAAPGYEVYHSVVTMPGAASAQITAIHAESVTYYRWDAVIVQHRSYAEAAADLEKLYNKLVNTIIKPVGGKASIVNGLYMPPAQDKTSSTIRFGLLPASKSFESLDIDLTARQDNGAWQIELSVYDRALENAGSNNKIVMK